MVFNQPSIIKMIWLGRFIDILWEYEPIPPSIICTKMVGEDGEGRQWMTGRWLEIGFYIHDIVDKWEEDVMGI